MPHCFEYLQGFFRHLDYRGSPCYRARTKFGGFVRAEKPSLAHHICRKNRDKIVVGTAFLDQPANIGTYDLHQVGSIAPDRALQFDTSSETSTLSCIHLDGLQAFALDLAHPEYDATPLEREKSSVVIGADKTLAAVCLTLDARRIRLSCSRRTSRGSSESFNSISCGIR